MGVNLQKAMKCSRMAFRFILLLSVYLSGAEDSLGKRGLVQKVWEVLKGKIAILGDTMTGNPTSELLIQNTSLKGGARTLMDTGNKIKMKKLIETNSLET